MDETDPDAQVDDAAEDDDIGVLPQTMLYRRRSWRRGCWMRRREQQGGVASPWCMADGERGLLLSRSDGVWRSADGGQTWTAVPCRPPSMSSPSGADRTRGRDRKASSSGNAGASWFEVESTLSGGEVYDLAADGTWVYAGAADGLYRSRDGMRWERAAERRGVPSSRLRPIHPGRVAPGSRASKACFALTMPGRPVASGPESPAGDTGAGRAFGAGRVMAAGSDGVWESTDGGVRWRPVVSVCPAQAGALVLDAEAPFLGGLYGVFRLGRSVPEPDKVPPRMVDLPGLGELIGSPFGAAACPTTRSSSSGTPSGLWRPPP